MLKEINTRIKSQMQIMLDFEDAVKEYIVEQNKELNYGARPLRRTLQTKVEDPLAEEILAGKIHAGDDVRVVMEDEQIKFVPVQ